MWRRAQVEVLLLLAFCPSVRLAWPVWPGHGCLWPHSTYNHDNIQPRSGLRFDPAASVLGRPVLLAAGFSHVTEPTLSHGPCDISVLWEAAYRGCRFALGEALFGGISPERALIAAAAAFGARQS